MSERAAFRCVAAAMTGVAAGLASVRAWPFAEARRLLARSRSLDDRPVLFETGYGPSGLPHLGTFAEVLRTGMVRRAFQELSDRPTRLVCFSDDMDALRRVPGNLPNPEALQDSVGLPLTRVPDPFGDAESFGAGNNLRLRKFLDAFGFEYEFVSATEQYRSGAFDEMLVRVLERFDLVLAIMLPTLGPERRATYSPFLPISPKTGRVLQTPTLERDVRRGRIVVEIEDGEQVDLPVTGGAVKLQWKPDWALRWVALGVDYEMFGKDLIDSAKASSRIAAAIGGSPPVQMTYEHFLDEEGQKISKSKGNGLTIGEWLDYAPKEALAWFLYGKPKTAKRLNVEGIPDHVERYFRELEMWPSLAGAEAVESPIWHVHAGAPPPPLRFPGYRTLANLAAVTGAEDGAALARFLRRSQPRQGDDADTRSATLLDGAARYARDVLAVGRRWQHPGPKERRGLLALRDALQSHVGEGDAERLQALAYEVGKAEWESLREWFAMLYRTLLGQSEGPRFGGLVAVYGVDEMIRLIERAVAGELAAANDMWEDA